MEIEIKFRQTSMNEQKCWRKWLILWKVYCIQLLTQWGAPMSTKKALLQQSLFLSVKSGQRISVGFCFTKCYALSVQSADLFKRSLKNHFTSKDAPFLIASFSFLFIHITWIIIKMPKLILLIHLFFCDLKMPKAKTKSSVNAVTNHKGKKSKMSCNCQ